MTKTEVKGIKPKRRVELFSCLEAFLSFGSMWIKSQRIPKYKILLKIVSMARFWEYTFFPKKAGVKWDRIPNKISSHIPMTAVSEAEWNRAVYHFAVNWLYKNIKVNKKNTAAFTVLFPNINPVHSRHFNIQKKNIFFT